MNEPPFTMQWSGWLESHGVRSGRVIRFADMPELDSSSQGDGRRYWLKDVKNFWVFYYNKAWILDRQIVAELLKLEWPQMTFLLPGELMTDDKP